ncbi:MAG: serine/threonine-protein phosphatase [Oscillatoriales cyanobacterium C42_A2020_001]|nr:serine/threonine-protein phosphatase [Leptolyngbyaceae cyanobacterium C42_A2020_001]
MTVPQPQVYCPNLNCSAPLNDVGNSTCANCQTPLIYRYVWAVGAVVLNVPVGTIVAGRYYVKAPQIWLDTQPALQPDFPTVDIPDDMQVYLYLTPHRLHIPEVYGVCSLSVEDSGEISDVMLLENVPLDAKGNLFPAIAQAWTSATAVRQVYWLWQLLELWTPLKAQGATASLLVADNIRVEGWRVRLCQLFWDEGILTATEPSEVVPELGLSDLAILWLGWVEQAQPAISDSLRNLCYEMRADQAEVGEIATQLNQLLLEQASQLPLRFQVASATDTGPQHQHNEDTCYPSPAAGKLEVDGIFPRLAIVCDGIGGHEGGEVASQMAVQSLKLQIQALLAEVAEQPELLTPNVVTEQLEAIVRVINDLIASQNDAQGREARRRMGTTLVMGLQLPQRLLLPQGKLAENSHELYLVNVGDSRAYWITPRYCHCLTLDDDVAIREVRMGRMVYREALQRSDAGALIQALGTRDSEFLHPSIQRFLIEEDGVLLLCSDGLSDNGRVEASWAEIMAEVFRGKSSLEAAAQAWIDLANQKNGHDNVSLVLLQCHTSSPAPDLALPKMEQQGTDWTESARALLQKNEPEDDVQVSEPLTSQRSFSKLLWILLVTALVLVGGGFAIWRQFDFGQVQPQREQVNPLP